MSDNWLRFIPTDPGFVPDAEAEQNAHDLLTSYVPNADETTIEVTEGVQFIDCGDNFERVLCPACRVEWDVDSWSGVLDEKYEAGFTDLMVTMPCCGAASSLNDLEYEWPQGFARFVLSALNPNVKDLKQHEFNELQNIVGHALRRIWCKV